MDSSRLASILQLEAYPRSECILIENTEVAGYTAWLKANSSEKLDIRHGVYEFLDAVAAHVEGRIVVLALGDSRTGSVSNWPYYLARQSETTLDRLLVINLGGWNMRFHEDRVEILEFLVPWLIKKRATEVVAIAFGLFGELANKQIMFTSFMKGDVSSPLSESEERLMNHAEFGDSVGDLFSNYQYDWAAAAEWIASRILKNLSLIETVVTRDGRATFYGVLEPSAWADMTPSYENALQRLFSEREDRSVAFLDWAARHGFCPNPSFCGPGDKEAYPLRDIFDFICAGWPTKMAGRHGANYIDWTKLFFDDPNGCFVEYDGMHYNKYGSEQLAKKLLDIIYQDFP